MAPAQADWTALGTQVWLLVTDPAQLAEMISSLGGTWPFEPTEEEKRMRSEILEALERNDPSSFAYTRGPGSGLRVPKHTNLAGDPLGPGGAGRGTTEPQSAAPAAGPKKDEEKTSQAPNNAL